MNRFKGLKDEAFKQVVEEVLGEYEARELECDDDEDVFYDHISTEKDLALDIASNPYKIRGIATGYQKLDGYLCGLSKGEMTAIAADTSVGKTLFALNIIDQAYKTTDQLFTTLYFSLDTATINIKSRMYMMNEQPEALPIYFYKNTGGITFSKVKKAMIKCKEENGLDLVVIDMLSSICRSVNNQTSETSSAVLKFRELALELDVHIILLNHISMAASKRQEIIPHYSDIKDSSSVYQDSDVVMMLGRNNLNENERDVMVVSVQKNRNKGRTGNINMGINWKTLKITEKWI